MTLKISNENDKYQNELNLIKVWQNKILFFNKTSVSIFIWFLLIMIYFILMYILYL